MTAASLLQALSPRDRQDAIWLLSSLFACSKAEVLLGRDRALSATEARRWRGWWKRRCAGEPLQYITRAAPFWGRDFYVDPRVLIPRPETEVLVEIALRLTAASPGARVLDIGTGSGCIALTLKAELPGLEVMGSDLSRPALAVARKNAARLGLPVRFERHDLFSAALRDRSWQLVVSNPPYLEFGRDKIAANVRHWEPRTALEPARAAKAGALGDRAAWCAERILEACAEARPGHTALELSPRVAAALERRWRRRAGVGRIWREADLAGRKRFLLVAWDRRDGE